MHHKILPQSRLAKLIAIIILPLTGIYAAYSISQTSSAPNISQVELSADPLYAQGTGQKPTLTLALSVEFPTVGAQYNDNNYIPTNTYHGYFDPLKCYQYDKNASNKHFSISGNANATTHGCGGNGFSGNFLNWSTSSSIDVLRLGLTGGDRIEDTATSTILQRAVLRKDFFDSGTYFPRKTLTNSVARQAIDSAMFSSGDTTDIRVSNCLNRVHIYTNGIIPSKSGTSACDDPGAVLGPILEKKTNNSMPSGFTSCADEGQSCSFTGVREVVYGAGKKWHRRLVKNGLTCNVATWGENPTSDSTSKKCYTKTTTEKFPMETITGDDFFYARVKACTTIGGLPEDSRPGMCQKYPNGNFKPVGNMQKYSDRIRLAAFGYLMENGDGRYGGVLRAPMTYVGPKTYDANGAPVAGENPYREWNTNTGVFIANPRSEPENISGVINYLNTFGRTGSEAGVYKSNDPVSELYYESLRYLQGLAPTPKAVENLTTANRNGFPVYSSWTDPFDGGLNTKNYACLKNSIILIGDVNTHADRSIPGNSITTNSDFDRTGEVSLANNIPNFKDWTRVVGGFEAGDAVSYVDGAGTAKTTSNPTTVKDTTLSGLDNKNIGSGGKSSYYMAGMAYWAHTHDIRGTDWSAETKRRPGMRVTTYVIDVNENRAMSNSATDRRRTHFFLAAKYGGFNDITGTGNPYLPANENGQYDSRHWEKENDPGEAKTYFLASDADKFLRALDDIFAAAAKINNTITSPSLSGNSLTTDDGYVYLSSFDPEYWKGDLKRNTISLDANGNIQQGNPQTALSAASKLDLLSDGQTDSRKIYIGKSESTAGGYANSFTWGAIDATTKAYLNRENVSASPDAQGEDRLKFLRGYRAKEAQPFRQRASRMGDIVNSGSVYLGAPTGRYNGTGYSTFYNNNKTRTKAVFVGANDGMLHAFNATTMDELFAYIPSWLAPKLSLLTGANYNSSQHTSYVDATPGIGEAQLGSDWKTVLVSGTGGGGQGVFALDVTNPNAFDASKVLWEFTDADDPDLGNVTGQPRIVKLRTSAPGASTETYKWFAAVPGGVNNYVNDGTGRYSTTGRPALFLLDLSKPAATAWSLGSNFFKIVLPISNDVAAGTQELDAGGAGTGQGKATGLININYTANARDAAEYFYFGDLHGQFWKLDMSKANLSSTTSSEWDLDKLSSYKNSSGSAVPMYIATTSAGKAQPITMVPTIAYGPKGAYILAFGTGKYLEARDNNVDSTTQTQSFYVLYDNYSNNNNDQIDTGGKAAFNGRSRLKQGAISSGSIVVGDFYWNLPRNTNSTDKKAGWFIDLPRSGSSGGERLINSAALLGKEIVFTSTLPPSASTDACAGGSSYLYAANLASGLGTVTAFTNGAQSAPFVMRVGSAQVSVSDSAASRTKTEKMALLRGSSTGGDRLEVSDTKTVNSTVGRLSWRQINNYRELKNKSD